MEESRALSMTFAAQCFVKKKKSWIYSTNSKCTISALSSSSVSGKCLGTTHDPKTEEVDPCLFGWKKASDGTYKPVWMIVPEVSHVCRELIK